jgi:steroid delta-isomerase-like uncharacterized protein
MQAQDMNRVIEAHLKAESAGDTTGCVAMYTNNVEHDVVGTPHGPLHGKDAAKTFYEHLVHDISTEEMIPTRTYYGEDFCVMEHQWKGSVPGSFLGIAGNGRRISFRMLHVWEFEDGLMSRENVWLDGSAIAQQLTGPEAGSNQ